MRSGARLQRYIRDPSALTLRLTERLIEHGISRRSALRGHSIRDGRFTLLTVDYNLTDYVLRLAQSFWRHVEPDGRVLVVQNGPREHNARLRAAGAEVVGFARNVGHGRALDWGLAHVKSQYVLICDPDSFIIDASFRQQVLSRIEQFGVAGIRVSDQPHHQYYHPICLAFETRLWKQSKVSFRSGEGPLDGTSPVPNDVGWELTAQLGGINPAALLPETRIGLAGAVFAESFTNTWGMSRISTPGNETEIDGRSASRTRDYHRDWTEWIDRIADGSDDVNGFPVRV